MKTISYELDLEDRIQCMRCNTICSGGVVPDRIYFIEEETDRGIQVTAICWRCYDKSH